LARSKTEGVPDPITTSPRGGDNDGIFFVPIAGSLQSAKTGADADRIKATRMALAGMNFLLTCPTILLVAKP
jgi:hypothetical protein